MASCDSCGNPGTLARCGRCKLTAYCSRECQVRHWREGGHKKECIKMCSRCGQVYSNSTECCVPHPKHLQDKKYGTFSPSTQEPISIYACMACNQSYIIVDKTGEITTEDVIATFLDKPGETVMSKWCFQGKHTLEPINTKVDQRVIRPNSIDLEDGPNLQKDLNALVQPTASHYVKRLTIRRMRPNTGGWVESYSLALPLHYLKVLHIEGVCVTTLHLDETLTPALTELNVAHLPDWCDFRYS